MECKVVNNEFCMQSVIYTVPMDAIRKDPANVNHVVRAHTRTTWAPNRASVCIIHFIVGLLSLQMTHSNDESGSLKAQVSMCGPIGEDVEIEKNIQCWDSVLFGFFAAIKNKIRVRSGFGSHVLFGTVCGFQTNIYSSRFFIDFA